MTSVLVFLAPGFEEIETATIIDVLRRCGLTVVTAGLSQDTVLGAHGVKFLSDTYVSDCSVGDFDAVICPGGSPGYQNLRRNARVLSMVKEAFLAGKIVGAICAGPAVLADAGVLRNKSCTIYPGMEDELKKGGAIPKSDFVVEDGTIITSQGPATAFVFSFKIAERLADKKTVELVKEKTLANLVLNNLL
jgi:4-methyl-5(b-hydroxyethyl)-thiazole monophosphate biosynthesis